MKRILVLGGAGYIGSQCCKLLSAQGYVPVTFDDLSTGHRDLVKWGPLVVGDIRDRQSVVDTIRKFETQAVLHFAARSLVGESFVKPEAYYDVNIGGTLSVLQALVETGVGGLVFSSTCAVYGDPDGALIAESQPKAPVNTYGFSKLVCEQMMDDFERAHGLKSVRLRYFNAAGADPECETGEDHDPETHLVPVVLDAALGRKPCVEIFGLDYATADGSAVRDYVHVVELADAHLKALEHLSAGGPTAAVNLGSGTGTSVLDVVRTVERVTGRPIPTRVSARREGDPPALVADVSAARKLLGWQASSEMETIISDAWRWHESRFGCRADSAERQRARD